MNNRYEFRIIKDNEAEQAVRIEQVCFPPNEACSEKNMIERIKNAPELFLVAVDKETGKIAGSLNGLATDEEIFRDEFLKMRTLIILKEKCNDSWIKHFAGIQKTRTCKRTCQTICVERKENNREN